jgi:hypothetical protein
MSLADLLFSTGPVTIRIPISRGVEGDRHLAFTAVVFDSLNQTLHLPGLLCGE